MKPRVWRRYGEFARAKRPKYAEATFEAAVSNAVRAGTVRDRGRALACENA